MNLDLFFPAAKGAEGYSPTLYIDTRGYLTGGYGHNFGRLEVVGGKVRFTPQGPLSEILWNQVFTGDVLEKLRDLEKALPWWTSLDEARQQVIADMAFNMGVPGLLKWPVFLNQVRTGQYEAAARNMESTDWYKQVGRRSPRLVAMMRTGKLLAPLKLRGQKKYFTIPVRVLAKRKRGSK